MSLHYTKKSAVIAPNAAFMTNKPTYKPKSLPELYQIYRSRRDETICTIRKPYLHHWLFDDLSSQYLVLHDNLWDVHPVNLTYVSYIKRNYTTLSDCDRGPEVVEHDNSIAMQSNVSKTYPQTIAILRNFVRHKMLEIFSQGRQDIAVDVVEKEELEPGHCESVRFNCPRRSRTFSRDRSLSSGRPPTTTTFAYSGMNYSKRRGVLLVANNAVAAEPLRPGVCTSRESTMKLGSRLGSDSGLSRFPRNSSALPTNISSIPSSPENSRSSLRKALSKKRSSASEIEVLYKQNLLNFYKSTTFEPNAISRFLHPRLPKDMAQTGVTDVLREKRMLEMDLKRVLTSVSPRRKHAHYRGKDEDGPLHQSPAFLFARTPYVSPYDRRVQEEKVDPRSAFGIEGAREVDRQEGLRDGSRIKGHVWRRKNSGHDRQRWRAANFPRRRPTKVAGRALCVLAEKLYP